jgi:hypothetical protein
MQFWYLFQMYIRITNFVYQSEKVSNECQNRYCWKIFDIFIWRIDIIIAYNSRNSGRLNDDWPGTMTSLLRGLWTRNHVLKGLYRAMIEGKRRKISNWNYFIFSELLYYLPSWKHSRFQASLLNFLLKNEKSFVSATAIKAACTQCNKTQKILFV